MSGVSKKAILKNLPILHGYEKSKDAVNEMVKTENKKIFVFDDDPTGTQTVNGIPVYTLWDEKSIRDAFCERSNLIYLLTNSRSMISSDAEYINRVIAERIDKISNETKIPFVIIHRGDSTLRGHYPLETEVCRKVIENSTGVRFDGEIIIPFFKEGGRFTYNDIHWAEYGDCLIPVGETEFAKDSTFGYTSSDLKKWIEEKTDGKFKSDNVISISIDMLRLEGYQSVANALMECRDFQKVIVNAFDYGDLYVFVLGLLTAEKMGKKFLFRTAASFVKVRGGIEDKGLLSKKDIAKYSENGGLIIVGSYTEKTRRQFYNAIKLPSVETVELDTSRILAENPNDQIAQITSFIEDRIKKKNIILYTSSLSGKVINATNTKDEKNLSVSAKISDALTSIVRSINTAPSYVIAKGGITSSDIATKGLGVKKADVLGQIRPGIPVWRIDEESKFPGLPYIIFPGNVGDDHILKDVISELE